MYTKLSNKMFQYKKEYLIYLGIKGKSIQKIYWK